MNTISTESLTRAMNDLKANNYGVKVEELDLNSLQISTDERAILECKMLGIPAWLHSDYESWNY